MHTDSIVDFYSGGADNRRRTLQQILAWSDEELEEVHDYIQWMFPTIQASGVNPSAPLVTDATIRAFEQRPELRDALRRSLDRMLAFYGLRRETGRLKPAPTTEEALSTPATTDVGAGFSRPEDPVRIVMDEARFADRARDWLHPYNHNHLRLTRIMDSLATLGLREEAKALQRCLLKDVYEGVGRGRITSQTQRYWSDAISDF